MYSRQQHVKLRQFTFNIDKGPSLDVREFFFSFFRVNLFWVNLLIHGKGPFTHLRGNYLTFHFDLNLTCGQSKGEL